LLLHWDVLVFKNFFENLWFALGKGLEVFNVHPKSLDHKWKVENTLKFCSSGKFYKNCYKNFNGLFIVNEATAWDCSTLLLSQVVASLTHFHVKKIPWKTLMVKNHWKCVPTKILKLHRMCEIVIVWEKNSMNFYCYGTSPLFWVVASLTCFRI